MTAQQEEICILRLYRSGTRASKHFLEKLYNNSIQNMITALYSNKEIKSSDIQELRDFLDKLEDE